MASATAIWRAGQKLKLRCLSLASSGFTILLLSMNFIVKEYKGEDAAAEGEEGRRRERGPGGRAAEVGVCSQMRRRRGQLPRRSSGASIYDVSIEGDVIQMLRIIVSLLQLREMLKKKLKHP